MTGMRDNLIHEYDEVDLDDVWGTIERDLPPLIAVVEPLVPRQDSRP